MTDAMQIPDGEDMLIWLFHRGPVERLHVWVTEDPEMDFVIFRGQVFGYTPEGSWAVLFVTEPIKVAQDAMAEGEREARKLASKRAAEIILERWRLRPGLGMRRG